MDLINFWAAVDRLAKTEAEKAKALGLSERALRDWKHNLPRPIRRVLTHPDLVAALAEDARSGAPSVDKAS